MNSPKKMKKSSLKVTNQQRLKTSDGRNQNKIIQ